MTTKTDRFDVTKLRESASAVLRHPELWPIAVRQLFVLAPSGWYRRWPPLPIPDADYMAFRMETAYGDGGQTPAGSDLVSYLRWCKRQPHLKR